MLGALRQAVAVLYDTAALVACPRPASSVQGCVRSEQKDDPAEVQLQEEMRQFGDILRVDLVDTYGDLSLKTMKLFATLPGKIDADFYFKVLLPGAGGLAVRAISQAGCSLCGLPSWHVLPQLAPPG